MATQMRGLLGLLKQNDPIIVSNRWHQRLGGNRHISLWIPHTALELVPCPFCHRCHRVRVKRQGHRYFFTCKTARVTQLIPHSTLHRWQFNLPRLLKHLACELRIKPQIAQLYSSIIWRLGTTTVMGGMGDVDLWLCRHISPPTLVWLLQQEVQAHTALLTIGSKPPLRQLALSFPSCDLLLLVRNPNGLCLDHQSFQRWLITVFQRVRFEPTNGDLWVDDQRACSAVPASAQFFFVQCLWEQFDRPVSHEDIFTYCRRQLAERDGVTEWHSEYLPASFCHTMKRLLKQQACDKARCDEIIQATRTHDEQNAYRLTTPSHQAVRSPGIVKNSTNSPN